MVAQLLKHLVEAEGFNAIIARDGLDGLETARRERPDLIVSDLHMPRMHGLDLVRALRADSETRDIPILILSGNEDPIDRAQALAAGADGYGVKGDSRQFVDQIEALLTRSGSISPDSRERRPPGASEWR